MNNVPFPQANDLNKIFKLITLYLSHAPSEILQKLKLNSWRQYYYYCDAACYLGFLKKENSIYKLNDLGFKLVGEEKCRREFLFLKVILRQHFIIVLLSQKRNLENDLLTLSKYAPQFDVLSKSTKKRRYSCIVSWLKEISHLINKN